MGYPRNFKLNRVQFRRGCDMKVTLRESMLGREILIGGVRRKLNVIPAFVNVCCFLIFPLLNCVPDSTLARRMIDRCCTL